MVIRFHRKLDIDQMMPTRQCGFGWDITSFIGHPCCSGAIVSAKEAQLHWYLSYMRWSYVSTPNSSTLGSRGVNIIYMVGVGKCQLPISPSRPHMVGFQPACHMRCKLHERTGCIMSMSPGGHSCQISNIGCTKSQNLNVSHLVL